MATIPGQRLEAAREAKGLSLAKAWAPVESTLGVLGCSMQQIRNYELGKVPEDEWNPLVVQVLAKVYGVTTAELSTVAAERTEKVLVLLGGDGAGRLTGGSSSAPSPTKQTGTDGEEWAARDSNPEPAESMPEAA